LHANLTGASVTDANLIGAYLYKANFTGASLVGANLQGANIRAANFANASLQGAVLSGAVFDPKTVFPALLFDPKALGAIQAGDVQIVLEKRPELEE
jgi:uncharacterized protein YjbI with pentapeptide repeats